MHSLFRFKTLKKLYGDTAGSAVGGCDETESVFTDQCRQATLETIGAKVSEMASAGHEFDHADGLSDIKGCFLRICVIDHEQMPGRFEDSVDLLEDAGGRFPAGFVECKRDHGQVKPFVLKGHLRGILQEAISDRIRFATDLQHGFGHVHTHGGDAVFCQKTQLITRAAGYVEYVFRLKPKYGFKHIPADGPYKGAQETVVEGGDKNVVFHVSWC